MVMFPQEWKILGKTDKSHDGILMLLLFILNNVSFSCFVIVPIVIQASEVLRSATEIEVLELSILKVTTMAFRRALKRLLQEFPNQVGEVMYEKTLLVK